MNVAIVGAGPGFDLVRPYLEDSDTEVWATASIYPVLEAHPIDRVFEIHREEKWRAFDYSALGDKLVLPYYTERCPGAECWSTQALVDKYGVMFQSTIAWMIAYAIERGAKRITLLGVDMGYQSEYGKQRDGLFFLLGQARAYGVEIEIPETSKLNIFGQQYGD